MKVSGVSPERCETICPYPAQWQVAIASSVSVTDPTWLSSTGLQALIDQGTAVEGPEYRRRAQP